MSRDIEYYPPQFDRVDARLDHSHIPLETMPVARFTPVNHHGVGTISGVVKEDGIPKPGFRCDLVNRETGIVCATTLTTSSGYYEFTEVDGGWEYDVIAYDGERYWEKKVSSRRRPILPQITHNLRCRGWDGAYGRDVTIRYRYIRLYTTEAYGYVSWSEFRIIGMQDENLTPDDSGFFHNGAYYSNREPLLFNGVLTGDYWASSYINQGPSIQGYEFGRGVGIKAIQLAPFSSSPTYERPITSKLQVSLDGKSWTTMRTFENFHTQLQHGVLNTFLLNP